MTLLAPAPAHETVSPPAPVPWWQASLVGAVTALASLVVIVAPVLFLWAVAGRSPGTWPQAVGLAAATWLGTLGGHVTFDGFTLSFVPLGLVLLPVVALALGWRWLLHRGIDDGGALVGGLVPRSVLAHVGAWWAGFAAIVALAAALTPLGPARPAWPWLVVVLLAAPVAGCVLGTVLHARRDPDAYAGWFAALRLADWLVRSVGPAVRGVVLLLAVGLAVVLAGVGLHWDQVRTVQDAVGSAGAAGPALTAVQVAALPNLALWATSFLAGPGFSVVQGASVTWTGATTGLMPLIPVLGAHPQPQAFPWFTPVVALVPVVIGGLIARSALRTVARLSSIGKKLKVTVTAAMLAAGLTGLLDVFGGASLGSYRLADIGAPAAWLALALAVELTVGAVLVVLWDAWRLRR